LSSFDAVVYEMGLESAIAYCRMASHDNQIVQLAAGMLIVVLERGG
jgi:hypothetical protein